MAVTLLLLLLLLGAAQATAPPPCQGDPSATRCAREQQCQHLQDSLALDSVDDVADGDDGDSVAPGKGIKCRLCIKVLKKLQALAGDNPDESAVEAALKKACQALGRSVGRLCQKVMNKYREQITEGLQNGDMPRDICTAMGICRS
ncbi:unnamed protein product [Coccothraustes coccothraustes]